jgi:hypothetical protein
VNRTWLTAAASVAALVALLLFTGEQVAEGPRPGIYPFIFTDAGEAAGLFPDVANIWGHGAAWGDVDGDGWIDLYVTTFHMPDSSPNMLFRNKRGKFECDPQKAVAVSTRGGKGNFTDISRDCGACPPDFGGRSATVLDYDGDGLLDILVGEDPFPGYNGSKTKRTRLFRNKGGLKFEDVTDSVGIPKGGPWPGRRGR